MTLINAFLAAVGLVGTIFGIINWYFSYRGTIQRRNSILITIIAAIVFLTFLFAIISPALENSSDAHKEVIPPLKVNTSPIVGSSPTSPSTATSTSSLSTPSPTPTPTSALPCIVNVGTWTNGSPDWKTLNNALLNDGTNDNVGNGPSITAPCQLGHTTNYAVETSIQVTTVGRDPCFGMSVRGNPTSGRWQGYKVGVGSCACCDSFSGGVFIGIPDYPASYTPLATFNPDTKVHTYRVEARDNTIKFFIDGAFIFNVTDNNYLTGSEVGLWCENVQLEVTSFKVVSL